jgi:hypothetical protein
MPTRTWNNLTLFAWLLAVTIIATAAMVPALLFLLDPARPKPLFGASGDPIPFITGFAIANAVLSAVAIVAGLRLEPLVRIGLPLLRSRTAADGTAIVRSARVATGLAVGAVLCGIAFRSHLPPLPEGFVFPPVWQGALMMLGAAVREEILFRFFALNLLVWMVTRLTRNAKPTAASVWAANVLISLAFAVAHLVPASQLLAMNATASGLAVALATLAGAVLGQVYWRHGLIMAIFTHGVCGLLLYLGGRSAITLLQ